MPSTRFVIDEQGFMQMWNINTGEFEGIVFLMGMNLEEVEKQERKIRARIKAERVESEKAKIMEEYK